MKTYINLCEGGRLRVTIVLAASLSSRHVSFCLREAFSMYSTRHNYLRGVVWIDTRQTFWGRSLPQINFTLIKTLLNPMWKLVFNTQKCWTRHHSAVALLRFIFKLNLLSTQPGRHFVQYDSMFHWQFHEHMHSFSIAFVVLLHRMGWLENMVLLIMIVFSITLQYVVFATFGPHMLLCLW